MSNHRFPRTFPRSVQEVSPARHGSQAPRVRPLEPLTPPPPAVTVEAPEPQGRAAAVRETKREQHAEAMVKAAARGIAPDAVEPQQKLAFHVRKALHKKLKALAVERETTIRDLVEQALLQAYGFEP